MVAPMVDGCKPKVNLDWTRDPSPSNLSPYQAVLRSLDWSKTSVGPMNSWSRELRQTVLMVIAEVKPVILYWGDDCTMIYNEAYIPLVGSQHPHNLGLSAPVIFPSFWGFFDEIISEQRVTGQTRTGEASMLLLQRKGYTEESFFDWTLIPVIGDSGEMLGAYGRPSESTSENINKRRVACIQTLSQKSPFVENLMDLWTSIPSSLCVNDIDLPLVLVYSIDYASSTLTTESPQNPICQLRTSFGLSETRDHPRQRIDLQNESDVLASALLNAWSRGENIEILTEREGASELAIQFRNSQWRGHGVPSQQFVVLPTQSRGVVVGLLVIGLNPYLKLDPDYREFLNTISTMVSSQFSSVQLAEEVESRTTAAKLASLEFQKSESKFLRFAERSPVGLALTDVYGKVHFANEAWLNFTGLDGADIDQSSWLTAVHDEDVPRIKAIWENLMITKKGSTCQVRSKVPFERGHMKSSHRTALCSVYPDLDEDGEISTVMGTVLDISEQKWVEEQLMLQKRELAKSESKYRTFAERSPHGVICTDAQGYMTFANDAWHNFYGLERGELTEPEPWLALLDEQDRMPAREYFRMVRDVKGTHTIEVRQKRRLPAFGESSNQTQELWLMSTGWAEHRPDGSVESMIFWVTDITTQKLAARVLEEKMEEAIRLKTQQERFIDMISHEIRNPLSAILHCGEDIVDSMKNCLTAMDVLPSPPSLPPEEADLQNLTRDHVNSALDAANTIMYCVQHQKQIVDDVLTLSKLDSDLLVVTPIPVRPRELLDSVLKIFDSEARASDIQLHVENTDSLKRMDIDWVMLDPNRFLQIVINLLTNAIKFTRNSTVRSVSISVSAQADRPPSYHNGVKYVPQNNTNGVKPKANTDVNAMNNSKSIEHSENEDLYLCFSVTDTGKGLSEKERRSLFNRFAQGSPKTHTEYGGSGLGLFISRQITEMLGGEIGVGAAINGGCKFAFYVKTRKVTPPKQFNNEPSSFATLHTKSELTLPSGTSIGPEKVGKGQTAVRKLQSPNLAAVEKAERRVLVVEDNLINQKVLCKQLRNRGFEVSAANHGKEALDILLRDGLHSREGLAQAQNQNSPLRPEFEVILCDIEMPVMDGIECVTEIRKLEANGSLSGHIPIIGVTANVRSKQVSTAIEVGMDGVTTKPYRIDDLIAHIDRVCAARDLSRSQSPSTTST